MVMVISMAGAAGGVRLMIPGFELLAQSGEFGCHSDEGLFDAFSPFSMAEVVIFGLETRP